MNAKEKSKTQCFKNEYDDHHFAAAILKTKDLKHLQLHCRVPPYISNAVLNNCSKSRFLLKKSIHTDLMCPFNYDKTT